MKAKLQVLEQDIGTYARDGIEYICITDIARNKNAERTGVIIEFDFKKQAGLNSFTLTPKPWIEQAFAMRQMRVLVEQSLSPLPTAGEGG